MGGDGRDGPVERLSLTAEEAAAAERLLHRCNDHEGLTLPIDLEPADAAPDNATRRLLYYEHGALLGFLRLSGLRVPPGAHPVEVCGIRRDGIDWPPQSNHLCLSQYVLYLRRVVCEIRRLVVRTSRR